MTSTKTNTKTKTAKKVDEEMIQIARNKVTVRLEFEARAKQYYDEAKERRKEAQRELKKLEKTKK